jgi:hypothetical protein
VQNYFSCLLNVRNVSDAKQIEVNRAEPLVPRPGSLEVGIVIAELEMYKSPSNYQVPAELIQAGGECYCLRSTNS